MDLDSTTYVERIAYNAKGQRTLIALGSGVMTRYAYDPDTFRLTRLRSEPCTTTNPSTYHPSGAAVQDFGYAYDLTGNLLTLTDRTPGGGLPIQPDQLDRSFSYDPLYRLLTATGRECDTPPPPAPWDDHPKCTDLTRTRAYTEAYTYDPVGNIRRLCHRAGTGGFTRDFTLDPDNSAPHTNRLSALTVGGTTSRYTYDTSGNLAAEDTSRHFEWDHSNRMRAYRTQTTSAEPSVHTHYLYDSTGQRVKKLVRKQAGQIEVTVYIDGTFEQRLLIQRATSTENNTIHVMDAHQRVALVRVGPALSDDISPDTIYHLGDHLGSSNAALDNFGNPVNREEYTPYGETSFGSYSKKRYRYTGKERDEESSLNYHEARYYAPWLCRWASCDPVGHADGVHLYSYVRNSPTRLTDPRGLESGPKDDEPKAKASKPPGKAYQRGTYKGLRGVKIDGNKPTIREHGIPGAQFESLHYNPRTGRSDYRNHGPEYRADGVYLNSEANAAAKTHEHGQVPSDNSRTRSIKLLQSEAAAGRGPGANLNEHLYGPSVTRMVETETPLRTAEQTALEQMGNSFSVQRLHETGQIVELESSFIRNQPSPIRSTESLSPTETSARGGGFNTPVFVLNLYLLYLLAVQLYNAPKSERPAIASEAGFWFVATSVASWALGGIASLVSLVVQIPSDDPQPVRHGATGTW